VDEVSWLEDGKPGCRWATEIPLARYLRGVIVQVLKRDVNIREENRIVRALDYASRNSRTKPLSDILVKLICACIERSLVGRAPAGRHLALARTSVEEPQPSARVPAMATRPLWLAESFWPVHRLDGCPVTRRRVV
jgi:hypothetical protein